MEFSSIVYIDPSIAAGGNGTTPETALKMFPAAGALEDNTMYVIRRTIESVYLTVPTGTSGVTRLGFVGMPVEADDPVRYAAMPEVARIAWGADSAGKAQMRITSTSYLTLENLLDFELYNVNIVRASAISYSGYGAFYLTRNRVNSPNNSNWYNGTISIDRCRFASADQPIDQTTYTSSPTAGMGCCYVSQSGAVDNIHITNSVVCFVPSSSGGGSTYGLNFTNPYGNVCLSNLKIYAITSGSSVSGGMPGGGGCAINISNGTQWALTRIRNIYVKYRQTSGMQYPGAINFSNTGYGAIDTDIRGVVVEEGDHIAVPTALGLGISVLKFCGGVGPVIMDSISVTLPKLWYVSGSNPVVYCGSNNSSMGGMYGTSNDGMPRTLKNIQITLAGTTGGLGAHNTIDHMKSTYASSTSYRMFYTALAVKGLDCSQVSIIAPWLRAVSIEEGSLEAEQIAGNVYVNAARVKVGTLTSSWYACLLMLYYGCVVSIDNLVGDAVSDTTDEYVVIENESTLGQSYVFISMSNKTVRGVQPVYPTSTNNQYYPFTSGALTVNNNGMTGRITVYGVNYVSDTWSAHRTGSTAASLKIYGNQGFNAMAMPIGMSPGMIAPKTVTGAGSLRITVHAAFLSIANFARDFIIEAITTSGVIISTGGGQWTDDPGVWLEVADGIVPKQWSCIVPGDTVAFRFYFRGYDPNGYMFLDPTIEVEAL